MSNNNKRLKKYYLKQLTIARSYGEIDIIRLLHFRLNNLQEAK